ncbi:hypothetical protein GQ55_4G024300 [Panicum hallii var. hallii]|uniref:Uncharacterized protein n=1 Tax=Panicum hallii var. hallii TaxID=1504633 RepID=A0A2T7DUH9_9POAL|nr:hypothetical protein GQ55_4G024300 [Panicum hallii var. hallii]
MEQKMALVKQRTTLLDSGGGDSDKDDDYHPMDDELSVVVAHQPVAIPCGDTDDDSSNVIPIKMVRPRRVRRNRRKLPGVPQTDDAKQISKDIHITNVVRNFLSWKIIISIKALNFH